MSEAQTTPGIESVLEKLNALESRIASEGESRKQTAASAPQAPEQEQKPRVYTRAEIDQAVRAGKITDEMGERILRDQEAEKMRAEAREEARQAVALERASAMLDEQMKPYLDAYPEIQKEGTEARDRLAKAYQQLVNEGNAATKQTELNAMRIAFGPPPQMRDVTSSSLETDSTGGGSPSSPHGRPDSKDPLAGLSLTQRQRDYYESRVASGSLTYDRIRSSLESKAAREKDRAAGVDRITSAKKRKSAA